MSGSPSALSSVVARLRWRAILLGFAIDYGGSVTFGFVSGLAMSFWHASRGGHPGETLALLGLTYYHELPGWYFAASMAVIVPCALLGAWLASLFFPSREASPPPLPPTV